MYLTGTEELAITLANGQVSCPSPKKVLICHIPPGNPANAHDICVGMSAVVPHQTQHGDTIGACITSPLTDAGVDGGGGGGSGSGGGGGGSGSGSGDSDGGVVP